MKSFLFILLMALITTTINQHYLQLTQSTPTSCVGGSSSLVMQENACNLLGKKADCKARIEVNLQWKRFYSDELRYRVCVQLSTKGVKTVNKYGSIDAGAKRFGVDLTKF
ncbi:hypothetical protein ACHAW6_001461 [Cyclotella cf. meneghiniana]